MNTWYEVVPNGFGVAYLTCFDGASELMGNLGFGRLTHTTDYMQFTITSRTEMPNEEFVAEISHAAEDLYALYFGGEVPVSRL